jgi:hypothetical protein
MATALMQSKADEEAKWSWPGLDEVVELTSFVVERMASLPPPPPLPPHAPPWAEWEGQMVSPPPQYAHPP